MARRGYKVISIEAKSFENLGTQFDTIHLDQVAFEELEIPLPEMEAPVFGGRDRDDAKRLMNEYGPMIRRAHPVHWDDPTTPVRLEETEHIARYGTSRF
jgi:hypothetical protein